MNKYINFIELIKLDRKDPKWVKKKKQYDEYLVKKMEHYTATHKYMQYKLKRKAATEKQADEKPAQKPAEASTEAKGKGSSRDHFEED